MTEQITLNKVSGTKTSLLEVSGKKNMPSIFGREKKRWLSGALKYKDKSREVKLIEREYENVDALVESWELGKKAGLPVPQTLRKTESGTILVTDFTADGSKLYGSSRYFQELYKETDQDIDDQDYFFIRLIDFHLGKVSQKGEKVALLATKQGLCLPFDDPFDLRISPDFRWDIVIPDMVFLTKFNDSVSDPQNYKRLLERNMTLVERRTEMLQLLSKKLKKRSPLNRIQILLKMLKRQGF